MRSPERDHDFVGFYGYEAVEVIYCGFAADFRPDDHFAGYCRTAASLDGTAGCEEVLRFMDEKRYDVVGVRERGVVAGFASRAQIKSGPIRPFREDFRPEDLFWNRRGRPEAGSLEAIGFTSSLTPPAFPPPDYENVITD